MGSLNRSLKKLERMYIELKKNNVEVLFCKNATDLKTKLETISKDSKVFVFNYSDFAEQQMLNQVLIEDVENHMSSLSLQ